MELIVFANFEAFRNYSRNVASRRDGKHDWSIHATTPGTMVEWPRAAVEKIDMEKCLVELTFIPTQQVLNAANDLRAFLPLLSDDERLKVHMLALGLNTYRADCEEILKKYSREHFQQGRKSVEMQFLSEVFSKSPDLMLRNSYRKQILESIPPGVSFDAEDSHFMHNDGWMPKEFEDHWRERGAEFPKVKFM